jgi:hypothetical protein
LFQVEIRTDVHFSQHNACIVDEHIDLAHFSNGFFDHRLDLLLGANVSQQGQRTLTFILNLFGNGIKPVWSEDKSLMTRS